ncbi:glycosyltransferase family 4 protein [archaeon]|jgi:1,2-diacylglycerol 3-alpha-glucosyltransferase|nr:glycosyltransferase family 4 protein [archaeon]MBT3450677.1 glycosyltransferase family 4 protein [archaeon]MBT6868743.1 glycosyltransferase family 4 protein [archaeon]MBT7193036.1 glycosyltransferase family 4 protein [archaeon]MBT7381002.1 glycosyltransferase family 4 protein [archaeon]
MNDKIKLLVAVDTYYPKIDGTLKFVEEFVKRSKDDFEIHMLVPNFQGKKSNSKITFLDVSKVVKTSGYSSIKLLSISNFLKIYRAVKNSDIVFAQGPALLTTLTILFSKILRKKCVYYMHVKIWEFFKNFLVTPITKMLYIVMKPVIKISLNLCSLIIIPYHELQEELVKEGIRTEIKIARLGVDIDKFKPVFNNSEAKKKVGIKAHDKVIGYVGRISNEKNLQMLLDAFNKIDIDNKTLLIVGDGNSEIIDELNKVKKCKVTGFVKNVEDYLKAMDVFVMPSKTETTSLATLEAMSSGLPVLVTKVGFIKNYIVKDYNGIFIARNNSELLTLKIEKILEDEIHREKISYNARKTVAYSFSWDRSINRIKRILKKKFYEDK